MNEKECVLIVDDEPANLRVLAGILQDTYRVLVANSGEAALTLVQQTLPDMILLDVMMPDLDGFEVCRRLKADPISAPIPVLFVTALDDPVSEEEGLSLGAEDYITKPINPAVVQARVKCHLALYDQNRELEQKVFDRTRQLHETRLRVIQRLGRAAEYRDNETGMHVIRMSHSSRLLAEALGLEPSWVDTLYNAAPMHDVGKIGIRDDILLKPGQLTPQEREVMKSHTLIGAEIIGDGDGLPLFEMARSVALSHHEKWDGSGYPYGLSGNDIPLEGRIVALADVFDALTSTRPYKPAWSVEQAVNFLIKESGQHFDPDLTAVFLGLIPEIVAIMQTFSDHDE